MIVVIEKIRVKVERVNGIKLGDIDEIKTLSLVSLNLNGFLHISESNRIGGIDFVRF